MRNILLSFLLIFFVGISQEVHAQKRFTVKIKYRVGFVAGKPGESSSPHTSYRIFDDIGNVKSAGTYVVEESEGSKVVQFVANSGKVEASFNGHPKQTYTFTGTTTRTFYGGNSSSLRVEVVATNIITIPTPKITKNGSNCSSCNRICDDLAGSVGITYSSTPSPGVFLFHRAGNGSTNQVSSLTLTSLSGYASSQTHYFMYGTSKTNTGTSVSVEIRSSSGQQNPIVTSMPAVNQYPIGQLSFFGITSSYIQSLSPANGNRIGVSSGRWKNLPAGDYFITYENTSDVYGCSFKFEKDRYGKTISVGHRTVTLSIVENAPATCSGSSDGEVKLIATGLQSGEAISVKCKDAKGVIHGMSVSSTPSIYKNIAAGNCTVISAELKKLHTVICKINNNGVSGTPYLKTPSLNISHGYTPTTSDASFVGSKDVSCGGGRDGELTIQVSNKVNNFKYEFIATSQGLVPLRIYGHHINGGKFTFKNVWPGNYSLAIRKRKSMFSSYVSGCVVNDVDFKEITEPPTLQASIKVIEGPSCARYHPNEHDEYNTVEGDDGTIQVTSISGGTPPYYCSIDNQSTWQTCYDGMDIRNFKAGSHTIYFKDANNCIINASVTVPNPPNIGISAIGSYNGQVLTFGSSPNLTYKHDGALGVAIGGIVPSRNPLVGVKFIPRTISIGPETPWSWNYPSYGTDASNITRHAIRNIPPGTVKVSVKITNNYGKVIRVATGNYQRYIRQIARPTITGQAYGSIACGGGTGASVKITANSVVGPLAFRINSSNPKIPLSYREWTYMPVSYHTVAPVDLANGNYTKTMTQWYTGLPAGTHNFEVIDGAGGNSMYITISEPPKVTVSGGHTKEDVKCNGGNDGSITINATGGTGTLQYRVVRTYPSSWDSGWGTSKTITGLTSGEYEGYIKDANGCNIRYPLDGSGYPTPITINEPFNSLEVDAYENKSVTCEDGSDGEVQIAYTGGGTAPYTYSKDGITYVSKTTYHNYRFPEGFTTVYAKDANGCIATKSVQIGRENDKPRFTATPTHVLCNGDNTGSITLNVTNLSSTFKYYMYNTGGGLISTQDDGSSYTPQKFENLAAGIYQFRVEDTYAGCMGDPIFTTVTEPHLLQFTGSKKDISCFGGSDGEVSMTASGGVTPYTYHVDKDGQIDFKKITTAATQADFGNLGLGNYTLRVTDAHQCELNVSKVITQPDLLVFSSIITSVSCHSGSDGKITVDASGGTKAYEYSKDNGSTYQSSNVFTGLAEGTYFVTVRDAQGCTTGHTAYVPQPKPLEAFTTVTDVICNSVAMGEISFYKTQGGTPPYSYSVDGDKNYIQDKTLFTNLLAKTYDVWVKDANDCKIQMSVEVKEPTNKIRVETTNHQHITCFGGADGMLLVSATDGVGNYTYSLDGVTFQTSQKFENLTAQTYTITTKDAWGCQATNTFTLTQSDEILFSTVVTNLTCFETQDGKIRVQTPTGGNGTYSYSIDNGNNFQSASEFTGLVAGIYPTIVRDKLDCASSPRNVIVTQPDPLTVNANVSDVKCYLNSDGQVIFQGVGGTAPYQYSFDKGSFQNDPTYTGLKEGTYFITVRDKNLCEYSTSVQVNQPSPFTATAQVTADVLCKGEATGVIQVSPVGGVGGYTYSVDGGSNFITASSTITGLIAGNYQVVVKDANECTAQAGFYTIVEPAQKLGFTSIAQTMTSCFGKPDAVVDIQAKGGVAPYQYALDNGSYKNTSLFTGVSGGNHTIHIQDAHNCVFSKPFIIDEPLPLTFTSVKEPLTCFESQDGTLTMNAKGGTSPYIYSIDNGVSFQSVSKFTGLSAGNYSIVFKDKNGCLSSTEIATIIQPDLLQLNSNINHVSCFGKNDASVVFNGVGGNGSYQYNFDGQGFKTQQNYTSLIAGTYFVTVRDVEGCLYPKTIVVTQPAQIQAKASVQRHVYCKHDATGIIQVNVNGGTQPYAYSLNGKPFSTVLSGLVDGTYDVNVKDAQGCITNAGFVTITEPTQVLTTQVLSTKDITCFGEANGQVQFDAKGGTAPYYFSLDNVSFTSVSQFTGLKKGSYTLYVKDEKACIASTNFSLTQPDKLEFTFDKTPLTCFESQDGAITLKSPMGGQGGYSYSTDGIIFQNNPKLTGLKAGVYATKIKDVAGCISDPVFVTVIQPDALDFTVQMIPNSCKGKSDGRIFVTAQGGNAGYQWKKDAGGFQAATHLEYNSLSAGFYSVTLKDTEGCLLTKKIEVTEPDYLQATLDITHVSCKDGNDGKFTVQTTGGNPPFIYSLDNLSFRSSATFEGFPKSSGNVYFKDIKGCDGMVQYVINEPTQLKLNFVSVEPVICKGDDTGNIIPYITGGTPPYYYSRNGVDFQPSNRLENFSVGFYDITIKDALGCIVKKNVEVTEPDELLQAKISNVKNSICGSASGELTVEVSGGIPPYRYQWDDDKKQTSAKAINLKSDIYTVAVTDGYGCVMKVSSQIEDAQGPEITGLHRWNPPTCYGAQDGELHFLINSGNPPFKATWKDLDNPDKDLSEYTGLEAKGLGEGNYLVLVEDRKGCKTSTKVRLEAPSPVQLQIAKTVDINCFDGANGEIRLQATGGVGGYRYHLTLPNGNTIYQFEDGDFKNLKAGTYQVAVNDRHICTTNKRTITLTQPEMLQVTTVEKENPLCAGDASGFIKPTILGGVEPYQYEWSNGEESKNITDLKAGKYELVVRDANNCEVSLKETLTEPEPLKITDFGKKQPSCYQQCDANAWVKVKGGIAPLTYQWNDAKNQTSAQATDLCAGNYEVIITDAHDCKITQTFEIKDVPELTVEVTDSKEISCFEGCNGEIRIKADGGTGKYTYTWSHDESLSRTMASNLCQGTYTVIVTDESGCQAETQMNFTHPAQLQSELVQEALICNGKYTTLDAGKEWAGYIWEDEDGNWVGSDRSVKVDKEGTYTLNMMNENGCLFTDEVKVEKSDNFFEAKFTAPSVVQVAESVKLADISWPIPDVVEWSWNTENAQEIESDAYHKTIRFTKTGEYTIGFWAKLGECEDYIEQLVEVYPATNMPKKPKYDNSATEIILGLHPNPNSGKFKIGVRMSEAVDIKLTIYGLYAGGTIIEQRTATGNSTYELDFDLPNLPSGAYYVVLESEIGVRTISFVKE